MVFHSADDAYRFGVVEGWAAGMLAVPGVPLGLAQAIVRWGTRQYEYPFEFTHVTEIVDAGRAAEHQADMVAAAAAAGAANAAAGATSTAAQVLMPEVAPCAMVIAQVG